MRCSSCEAHLDRYVEGTLPHARMALLRTHLQDCASCSAMLEELRVVDALLATARRTEPAANFTFAVMAEVRSMPQPKPRTWRRTLLLGAAYVVAAWIVAIATFPQLDRLYRAFAQTAALTKVAPLFDRFLHPSSIVPSQVALVAIAALLADAVIVFALIRRFRRVEERA